MAPEEVLSLLGRLSGEKTISVMKEGNEVFVSAASSDMVVSVRADDYLLPGPTFSGAAFPGAALAALVASTAGQVEVSMDRAWSGRFNQVLSAGGHRFMISGEADRPPKGTPACLASQLITSGEVSLGPYPIILHQGYSFQLNTPSPWYTGGQVAAVSPDPSADAFDEPIALNHGALRRQVIELFDEEEEIVVWTSPRWIQLVGGRARVIVRHLPQGASVKSHAAEVISKIGDPTATGTIADLSVALDLISSLPVRPGEYHFVGVSTDGSSLHLSSETYAGRLDIPVDASALSTSPPRLVQPDQIKMALRYLKKSGSQAFSYHQHENHIHFTDGGQTAVMIAVRPS